MSCESETCTAEAGESVDPKAHTQVQQAVNGVYFNPRRTKFRETLNKLTNDNSDVDRDVIKERFR